MSKESWLYTTQPPSTTRRMCS